MAEKHEFKNKQKCQKLLEPKKLHARKLLLLQYAKLYSLLFGKQAIFNICNNSTYFQVWEMVPVRLYVAKLSWSSTLENQLNRLCENV